MGCKMTSPSRVTWEQANEAICSSMKAAGIVGALAKRMRQYSMQEELEIKRLLSTESVLARHWMNVGVQLLEKHEVLTRAQIDRVTAAEAEGGEMLFPLQVAALCRMAMGIRTCLQGVRQRSDVQSHLAATRPCEPLLLLQGEVSCR